MPAQQLKNDFISYHFTTVCLGKYVWDKVYALLFQYYVIKYNNISYNLNGFKIKWRSGKKMQKKKKDQMVF